MIIYLVSGITFQVSLAARNGSTRRESCAEIDSIIDDEEDDDGTLCCHGWHLDIDLFICVRMYMYIYMIIYVCICVCIIYIYLYIVRMKYEKHAAAK
jgi:hypothetical protein